MCSPTRSALQSGRHPYHVNIVNADPTIYNASESTGTGAGIPRNMTGMATKLRSVGYRTHMVGKWDAGMATPTHTPKGRGYETSLGYFHHGNSYWSDETGDLTCPVGVDLWDTGHPAHGLVPQQNKVEWNETAYEEHFFMLRLLQILDSYTPSDENPLFLFYAAHLVHDPLFVPQQYLNNMSKMKTWESLWTHSSSRTCGTTRCSCFSVTMADLFTVGGTTFPFAEASTQSSRVGVAAFASGGYIPMNSRGTVATGIGAVADIYTTFCAMAGVNATDVMGNAAGLPPVDGLDISPLLLGTGPSPRTEIILEPLDPKDQAALDVFDGLLDTTSVSPPFDVHKGFACGADNGYKIQFLPNTTLAGCEAACAALPSCQMFSHKDDSTPEPSHFCSLYNATARPLANPKFGCRCRGMCPEKPPPPPPGPPGPPAPPKPGKCGP
eukprot:m.92872 g.92872  ORF g.92872 m.92872 type:complete len:439 (-) comp12086_c0_seq2:653-1969(-)